MNELILRNRQRIRRLNLPLLRRLVHDMLSTDFGLKDYELGINLVGLVEMAKVNKRYLDHAGSTDVITFDHSGDEGLHGELFICVDEAILQAREFRTTWQSEIMRYIIHGLLHLQGHDDKRPAARRKMKLAENRLLRTAGKRHPFSKLERARPRA